MVEFGRYGLACRRVAGLNIPVEVLAGRDAPCRPPRAWTRSSPRGRSPNDSHNSCAGHDPVSVNARGEGGRADGEARRVRCLSSCVVRQPWPRAARWLRTSRTARAPTHSVVLGVVAVVVASLRRLGRTARVAAFPAVSAALAAQPVLHLTSESARPKTVAPVAHDHRDLVQHLRGQRGTDGRRADRRSGARRRRRDGWRAPALPADRCRAPSAGRVPPCIMRAASRAHPGPSPTPRLDAPLVRVGAAGRPPRTAGRLPRTSSPEPSATSQYEVRLG